MPDSAADDELRIQTRHWEALVRGERESDGRIRAVVDQAADALFILDYQGRIIDVNRKACESLGYVRDELLAMNIADIDHDAGRPLHRQKYWESLRPGMIAIFESLHRRKNGSVFPVEIHLGLLAMEGRRLMLGFARDITERKEAEAALREERDRARRYFEMAGTALVLLAPDGTVEMINRKGCEILRRDVSEIVGLNWFSSFLPEPMREQTREVFAALVAGQVAPVEYHENSVVDADGRERLVAWHNTVLTDSSGRITGVLTSGEDITERRQAEAELARYREHLEELVEKRRAELEKSREQLRQSEHLASVGTLAAGIAHEVNNPIGGILLAAELALLAGPDREAIREALTRIVGYAHRAKGIIHNVLLLARQGASEMVCGHLNPVVARAAAQNDAYAAGLGCRIELALDSELPAIMLNELEIEAAVGNLVRNAVEAHARSVRLTSKLQEDAVVLEVRDDGDGMPQESQDRLFDPFFTTRRGSGGTGLGLSIVHSIVRGHGGTIGVDTASEKGTVFTIRLPLRQEVSGGRMGS